MLQLLICFDGVLYLNSFLGYSVNYVWVLIPWNSTNLISLGLIVKGVSTLGFVDCFRLDTYNFKSMRGRVTELIGVVTSWLRSWSFNYM